MSNIIEAVLHRNASVRPPGTVVLRDVAPVPASKAKFGSAGPTQWSSFWQDTCRDGALHERCYVPAEARDAVDRHWAQFANALPHDAQAIDLGCGAGILGRVLLNHRNDLLVTGVDFAQVPMTSLANLTIHSWVNMEDLPFDDGSFDVAISLFGIEYGNIGPTARELARVLRPGARFSFLMHHTESEILREGGLRRAGLRETFSGPMKAAFLAGNAAGVDRQRQGLRERFFAEPSVKLFSDHLHRQVTQTRAGRQALWQKLVDDLAPEIALLGHLERSAKSALDMGAWLAPVLLAMSAVHVSVVRQGSGQPIAWNVSGTR